MIGWCTFHTAKHYTIRTRENARIIALKSMDNLAKVKQTGCKIPTQMLKYQKIYNRVPSYRRAMTNVIVKSLYTTIDRPGCFTKEYDRNGITGNCS